MRVTLTKQAQADIERIRDLERKIEGLKSEIDGLATRIAAASGLDIMLPQVAVTQDHTRIVIERTADVDVDRLLALAHQAGLNHLLGRVFDWRPSMNWTIWDSLPEEARRLLGPAIVIKISRPKVV